MAGNLTLGKNERLKSRKQIEELFEKGKKFSSGFFRVHFVTGRDQTAVLQFGVGVSNKNFKKAVDRNKIKRLAREAWRLQKNDLKEKLASAGSSMNVFLIYSGTTMVAYKEIFEATQKVLDKLDKLSSSTA